MAEDKGIAEGDKNEQPSVMIEKKHRGFMSRIWNGIFRLHGDDFEKRLQNIHKEEAVVLARMKKRSLTWRKMSRHLIIFSVIFEVCDACGISRVISNLPRIISWMCRKASGKSKLAAIRRAALAALIYHIWIARNNFMFQHEPIMHRKILRNVSFDVIAVGYAIMTARSMDLNWKMRAFRVLPMFLLPALSSIGYSTFISFTRMCDRKDQKSLEMLRAERQAKIDELKEKTNYYTTQQLIQRYDPDPAAKAAAATFLASKLGADSGLKVYVGDEAKHNISTGNVEFAQAGGLRNRKQVHTRSSTAGRSPGHHSNEEMVNSPQSVSLQTSEHNQLLVEHHNPQASTMRDGGWIARLAALLVGEDPTQSYAMICGNCYMHNGLARKEDFPYITYYCPHCHALNQPKQTEQRVSGSGSPSLGALNAEAVDNTSNSLGDSILPSNNPTRADSEIKEVIGSSVAAELSS